VAQTSVRRTESPRDHGQRDILCQTLHALLEEVTSQEKGLEAKEIFLSSYFNSILDDIIINRYPISHEAK